jgi:hypothetical protein
MKTRFLTTIQTPFRLTRSAFLVRHPEPWVFRAQASPRGGASCCPRRCRRVLEKIPSGPQWLASADPKVGAEMYAELGVEVAYDHEHRVVTIEGAWQRRVQRTCRRGDLNPYALAGTSPSS